jgi:hypothetical protein
VGIFFHQFTQRELLGGRQMGHMQVKQHHTCFSSNAGGMQVGNETLPKRLFLGPKV